MLLAQKVKKAMLEQLVHKVPLVLKDIKVTSGKQELLEHKVLQEQKVTKVTQVILE